MAKSHDINQSYETDEEKMSRINSAGLINSILENLWKESYNAMSNGDYLKWNSKLDAIWTILGGDCKEDGNEDREISKLNLKIYKHGSLKAKSGIGFNQSANPNNSVQYLLLMKKSLFLRRLQNKQGKGTAYTTDDDYDFD